MKQTLKPEKLGAMKKLFIAVCCCGLIVLLPAASAEQQTAAEPTNPEPVAAAETVREDDTIEIGYIEADLQNVLRTLAAKAGVNLILGDEVTGKVTVNLKGVSYEEAMRLIVESKGYAYVKDKNVVKVKSRDSLEAEPVEVKLYTLNYAKAEEVKKTLEPVLTKQGKIQVDVRSNSLILSDTPSNLTKLQQLIAALDTQTPQVMIEAKFIETTKNPKKDLGINWSGTLLNHELQARRPDPTAPIISPGGPGAPNRSPFEISKNLAGGPWTPATVILDAGEAKLVFSFLNADKDTELLANPRVVTTDNGRARISIATQFPIPQFSFSEQTASLQISGFEYKDIGIILNVVPRINKDDFVTLEVTPEASSSTESARLVSGGGSAVEIPIINTRMATTTVLIKSGHTLAIGGLMRQDVDETYTKVPLMGDIPGLGAFFRSKSLSKTKRDLLIFLTPTIVGPEEQTGFEKYYHGLPDEEVYTNDTWLPRDNAKPARLFGRGRKPAADTQNKPATNFGPR
jgi:type IV pilus assembly protein PilQ